MNDTLLMMLLAGFAIWYITSQRASTTAPSGSGGGTPTGTPSLPPSGNPSPAPTVNSLIVPIGQVPGGGKGNPPGTIAPPSNGGPPVFYPGQTTYIVAPPAPGGNPNYPGVNPDYIPGTMTSGGTTYNTGLVSTPQGQITYVPPPAPTVSYASNITPQSTVQGSIPAAVAATMVSTGSTAAPVLGSANFLQQTFNAIGGVGGLYPAWQQLYPDHWSSIFMDVTGITTGVPHAGDLGFDGMTPMTFANWWKAFVPYAMKNMGLSGMLIPVGWA